ncbi:hypothetical protein DM01DRAFT_1386995 [Hesseltinella vesiculosa]|uniref:3-oxo-5-alpha-steroid 4-dehydrogenase C-terminal domain-containing protein n=1 Tax=Hesseltinella vesiculosa TaxID=101127 RepID=A0A1X2G3Q7_9FUNG|nr:hypothetical protein DM01DRAFT_1386995 [Hesseltinella vesiculosa]
MHSVVNAITDPQTYGTVLAIYKYVPVFFLVALLVVDAPYGRFGASFGFEFGFSKNTAKVAWVTMEMASPLVLFGTIFLVRSSSPVELAWSSGQWLCVTLWAGHYFNRTVIHPLLCSSMSAMHIFTWLVGLVFNTINGYCNGYWLASHPFSVDQPRVQLGLLLWSLGCASNIYHDHLLFALRSYKGKKRQTGRRYMIPVGGLFTWLSAPNYISEVVEWVGFYLICGSQPALLFALSTMGNLLPRAYRTHQWYGRQFRTYHTYHRKALIPFVF